MTARDATQGLTGALARACRSFQFESLPPDVIFLGKQCVLDWIGVALAGSGQPLAEILRAQVLEDGGAPQATLVGSGEAVSASQAALVNGAAAHALDFDDVIGGMGHPTVPVLPALLAMAERDGRNGRDLLTAFVAGVEMETRIGAFGMASHYAKGFHSTGTLGTFGAAAGCAHLLGLDEEQWLRALGIAGTQAAGLKSMFGTMCKPLHAGKAAQNGLFAASLAARGYTANPAVLETDQGFAATQVPEPKAERALDGLGESYAIRTVLFKYHAACYGTHETIENMLALKAAHDIRPEAIEAIELRVPESNLAMCNIQEPETALEGKFSMRFTAAMALADGDLSEQAFTDERVNDPRFVVLRDRVSVGSHPAGHPDRGTEATIRLRDGTVLRHEVDLFIPATDLERQWERLEAKFRSLAEPLLGPNRTDAIVRTVQSLESLNDAGQLAGASVAAARKVAV